MLSALVLANCFLNQDKSAANGVKNIKGVVEVFRIYGAYDLIIRIQSEDELKLRKIVRDIRSVEGIQSVLTNIIFKSEPGLGAVA